jgi:hypothetical protein
VTKGVIIVENPQNGKILAMVSLPSYDDQLFADGISGHRLPGSAVEPGPAAPQQGNRRPVRARIDVQARHWYGRTGISPRARSRASTRTVAGTLVPGPTDCDTGNFTDTTTLLSQPYIQFGDFKYWEWNLQGWGPLNITGVSPTRATPSSTSWPRWSDSTG